MPAEIVIKDVARYFTLYDGQHYVRFGDFLYAFQTQLAFSEFIANCEDLFGQNLDNSALLMKMEQLNDGRLVCPPKRVLEEVVLDSQNLTFTKFLRRLAKSNRLNSYLGVLPSRGESVLASTVPRASSIDPQKQKNKSPRRRKKSV